MKTESFFNMNIELFYDQKYRTFLLRISILPFEYQYFFMSNES